MYDINNMPQSIEIGYTGETNYRTIEIDMTKWLETMPDGYPSIVHICPGKTTADAYIANTTFADGILSWTISASDLGATEGTGLAQVWMEAVENHTLNKEGRSAVFATIVRQSLSDEDPTVPPSQLPWLEQMTLLKTQTLIASDEAKAAQTEATTAATTAESAAATAESAAETASGAATDASDYAGQALASKGDAETAATAAAESASDASGSASAADDSADAAAASATAAAGSAADALSYRNAASGYANTASGAATTAAGSATAAEAWATGGSGGTPTATNNAKYYAELAESTVSRYEGLTVDATTLEPGNEATAEITEVSGHLNIAFGLPQGEKGEQGERGYDGDKGMDGVSPEVTVTEITGGHRVAVTDAEGTSTFDVMDGATGPEGPEGPTGPAGQDGQDGYTPVRGTDYWTAADKAEIVGDVEDDIIDDTAGDGDTNKTWSADKLSEETTLEKTLTQAAIQSFEGGAWPMGLQVAVDPVQDLHGYSNPWPGGGGKNKCPVAAADTYSGITLTNNIDGSITLTGTNGSSATYIDIFPGTFNSTVYAGYVFSYGDYSGGTSSVQVRISDSTRTAVQNHNSGETIIADNGTGLYLAIRIAASYAIPSGGITLYPMLRASTATSDWEPYSNVCPITGWTGANVSVSPTQDAQDATVYPIAFPTSAGTVYGGTLSVNKDGTGTLVVDKAFYELDGSSDEDWYVEGNGTYKFARTVIEPYRERTDPSMCNEFTYATIGNNTSNLGYDFLNGNHLRIRYGLYTSLEVSDVRTYFSNNPVQVVYYLATPVTYSLTPGQVLSLLGQNNVWADTGNILSLSYNSKQGMEFIREDTAGQIAPVETELDSTEAAMAIVVDGDTAPKNITSGQYVFVKNHSTLATGMYHATEAISSGASVTSSNVSADADGASNALKKEIEQKAGPIRFYKSTTSTTSYSFAIDRGSTNAFWFALLYIGTSAVSTGVGTYMIHIDTSNTVKVIKLSGSNARTFTGSFSNDVLTVTASDTVWGGIRVIMV